VRREVGEERPVVAVEDVDWEVGVRLGEFVDEFFFEGRVD
jgi:hypothetical protein